MRLILLGPPGAGKGTQAARIAEREALAHISTGDLFREAVREGTELGKLAETYMDRGELVPDHVTIEMLLERLRRPDARKGFVLDGFPRNLAQARALDEALAAEGRAVDLALHITVSDDELVRRLAGRWMCRSCGAVYHEVNHPPSVTGRCDRCGGELYQRDDDRPEVVRARLAKQKPPADLLSYYREAGRLVEVDGERPLDAVTEALLEAIRAGATR